MVLRKTHLAFLCLIFSCHQLWGQSLPKACPIYIAHEVHDGQIQSVSRTLQNLNCIAGSSEWTSLDASREDDDVYTEVVFDQVERTQCLSLTDFQLNIPPGAQIHGLKANFYGHREGKDVISTQVRLVGPGRQYFGRNQAQWAKKDDWPTGSIANDDYWWYGGHDETWTANLTSDLLNDPEFGIEVQVRKPTDDDTTVLRLDHVNIEVYFTPLYTICHDSCTVFYVDEVPGAVAYHWTLPNKAFFVSKDPNSNIVNLNVEDMDFGLHEICVQTISSQGMSDHCCSRFRLAECEDGSIGDRIFQDINNNGIQDPQDGGFAGVELILFDAFSDSEIARDTTDIDGLYSFTGIPEGYYYIEVDRPTGTQWVPFLVGSSDTDSDWNEANGPNTSRTIYLPSGRNLTDIDAGLWALSSIGDRVWNDINHNGLQDAGENGIAQIAIDLLDDQRAVVNSTVTDQNGFYNFPSLLPGDYSVKFDIPSGSVPTLLNQGVNKDIDSDVRSNGETEMYTLSFGDQLDHIDAGFFYYNKIQGTTWYDRNQDGLRDAIDPVADSILVILTDEQGVEISRRNTSVDGAYCFDTLSIGNYKVLVEIDPGSSFSPQDVGNDDTIDSDVDANGLTDIITLTTAEVKIADAGFKNNCGAIAPDLSLNKDPACFNGSAQFIEFSETSTSTVPMGFDLMYLLVDTQSDQILAGSNVAIFSVSDASSYAIYSIVYQPDANDFEFLDLGNFISQNLSLTDLRSAIEALYLCTDLGNILEFKIEECAKINGVIWVDQNPDGQRTMAEDLLENIEVRLLDAVGTELALDSTDINGFYEFNDIVAGDYFIQITLGSSMVVTAKDQGSDLTDSDINNIGRSDVINVSAGNVYTIDGGVFFECSAFAGQWLVDVNNVGCLSGAGNIINATAFIPPAIPMGFESRYLLVNQNNGQIVDISNTPEFNVAQAGRWAIHTLIFDPNPTSRDYLDISIIQLRSTTIDELLDYLVENFLCSDLSGPASFELEECGQIIGSIFYDQNENNIQDAIDIFLEDIEIILEDDNGIEIGRDTTDQNGDYAFIQLIPKNYRIIATNTSGTDWILQDFGADDNVDSDLNALGRSELIVLVGGAVADVDGGLKEECEVMADALGMMAMSAPCLSNAAITISAGLTSSVVPPQFRQIFLLMDEATGIILEINDQPQFNVTTAGTYRILSLVYSEDVGSAEYFDISRVMVDMTTREELLNWLNTEALCSDFNTIGRRFEVNECGQIQGVVWVDDENGTRELNEDFFEGVTINLLTAGNVVVDTRMTNLNGDYSFDNVPRGLYRIQVIAPAGWEFTGQAVGMDDTVDSDVDNIGISTTIILNWGQNAVVDAGLNKSCELTLPTIENIRASDLCWSGDTMRVRADLINMGNVPSGYSVNYILSHQGWIDTVSDQLEFTVDTFGIFCIHAIISHPDPTHPDYIDLMSLSNGQTTVDQVFNDITNDGLCAAVDLDGLCIQIDQCAGIGDFVWLDENENGIQDAGETGISGARVSLYDENGQFLEMQITSAIPSEIGHFLFTDYPQGDYYLIFEKIPSLEYSFPFQGADRSKDSNVNGLIAAGSTPIFFALSGDNLDIDCGFTLSGSTIGNRVWEDIDGDGIQDNGEPGINGIMLELRNEMGVIIFTEQSRNNGGVDGFYSFDDVTPGNYYIQVSNPQNYLATKPLQGIDATLDNDIDDSNGPFTSRVFTMVTNQGNDSLDIGLVLPAGIGDRLWFDENTNGLQDIGEAGINGQEVKLYDGAGTLLDSVVTTTQNGIEGFYFFDDLFPGQYFLGTELPSGTALTKSFEGNDARIDNNGDSSNGLNTTSTVTLLSGVRDSTIDIGAISSSCIGDYVWTEIAFNGINDFFERGRNDVGVILFDALGNLIDSTFTQNDVNGSPGFYSFENVTAGNYYLEFVFDQMVIPTLADQGMDDDVDSDLTGANGLNTTDVFSIALGDSIKNIDLGLTETSSVGNRVWCDDNANGLQDSGESGINGIKVYLYSDLGTLLDSTVTADLSGTSDPGFYVFADILPGAYYLIFGSAPDKVQTLANAGNDESLDSDVDNSNGFGSTSIFNLSPGENDQDIDAGFVDPGALLSEIGDYVWLDRDNDGIQDGFESGLNGVLVELYDINDVMIESMTTDYDPMTFAPGYYAFDELQAGQYYLVFTPPTGYEYAASFAGFDNTRDSDISNVKARGSTNVLGLFAGESKMSVDAGFVQFGSLGDYVWKDVNADGIQNMGEDGMNGVQVHLYNRNNDLVATATTEDDLFGSPGYYVFNDIDPDGYYLKIDLPQGYAFTNANEGGDDTKDSDIDNSNGFGTSSIINISPGEHDRDADIGVHKQGMIGRLAWLDDNHDGIKNPNEGGLEDIHVMLYNMQDSMFFETYTDEKGRYVFDRIPMGAYYVQFELPRGYAFSTSGRGGEFEDSDVSHKYGYGTTDLMEVYPGQTYMMLDAGIVEQVALALEILDFEVSTEGELARLVWEMGEESDIVEYIVQRRHESEVEFSDVGRVNMDVARFGRYDFEDKMTLNGTYFYRIKVASDLEQEFFSETRSVENGLEGASIRIYPNPVSDFLILEKMNKEASIYWVELISMDSRVIIRKELELDMEKIDLSDVPAGPYIIQVGNESNVQVKEIIQVIK